MQSAHPYFKGIVQDLHCVTSEAKMKCLGATGGNIFYCKNYISPSHMDNDKCRPLTAQVQKHCHLDEYHFAYTKWGFFVQIESEVLWYVHWPIACIFEVLLQVSLEVSAQY